MILPPLFYAGDTAAIAQKLLGCYLVRLSSAGAVIGRIVETEAYLHGDPAAHSYRGETERTRVMFGAPGHAYVYFIYGMHFCVNAVTGLPDRRGEAVLIRALEPVEGIALMMHRRRATKLRDLCSGPGKLCQALDITRDLNGVSLSNGLLQIWSADTLPGSPENPEIVQTTRIGIQKAADLLLRLYLKDNLYISRK
jgi:DNA-3-methyladenine glycosylase